MSKQTINIGASPNDGTGTPLRTSFDYTNQNFTELYTAVGPSGNNIVVPGNATITGDLTVDTSTLKVDSANDRVGIRTATPANTLEVVAPAGDNIVSTFRSGDATAANNAGGGFRSISSATAASRVAQIWLDADGANFSGGDYFFIQKNGSSGTVEFNQSSNAAMTFLTNSTERMRIDSSGNVGIGVTPSAWGTYKGLQVGYASLAGYAGADTFLGSNVYFDGGAFRYIAAGLASSYRQLAGSHQWSTAVAGVNPGDTLTVLPLATLDASGNFSPIGNVVMANTKGIDFSAVTGGTGTATANVLNDYEEGTWVPTVGGTSTYTIQQASYIKVGRLVTVSFDMAILLLGTGSTTQMSGLPFVVGSGTSPKFEQCNGAAGYFQSLAVNVYSLTFNAGANGSMINSTSVNTLGGTANVNPAIYGNGTRVQGTVTYMAA